MEEYEKKWRTKLWKWGIRLIPFSFFFFFSVELFRKLPLRCQQGDAESHLLHKNFTSGPVAMFISTCMLRMVSSHPFAFGFSLSLSLYLSIFYCLHKRKQWKRTAPHTNREQKELLRISKSIQPITKKNYTLFWVALFKSTDYL